MPHALPELLAYLEGLPEPHILVDPAYTILGANSAYAQRFGSPSGISGKKCFEVSHHFAVPCDQAGESCPLTAAKRSGKRERVLHLHHTPLGREYVNIELVPVHDDQSQLAYFVEKIEPLDLARGDLTHGAILGRSAALRALLQSISRVAHSNARVLLLGESGTGKELVAKAIHDKSGNASGPFVVVDCASLSESLFESELFGHERGAFTGATHAHAGLAEAANGGTLFLDEAGDIPLAVQVKLLRLLETGTYRRVGSTELRRSEFRVISATNKNIQSMISDGRFRQDLYYRLSTFPIHLPALRERSEDIPLLAESLLARLYEKRQIKISADAMSRLQTLSYPGNVRELRNLLERAALFCDADTLDRVHVEQAIEADRIVESFPQRKSAASENSTPLSEPVVSANVATLYLAQRQALEHELRSHTGSRAELASKLGISERSLYRKLRLYGLLPRTRSTR